MDMVLNILSWVFILAGSAFVIIGAIGVMRLPEVFTRSHAAGMVDTFGTGLILLGLMFQAGGFNLVLVKLVMIGFFLFFTSPVSSHALVRAAMADGAKPLLKEGVELEGALKDEGDKPS
ncbi:monovalent cation/H(+) antiporter subunit G [Terasakiella sp. A23]|uniref:monovalent cation/H(+) antiporter subunit G n=1 Tax=Terasakiella sp. FCG-A23 TaxID=3080561 RepID=UPI00295489D0|nr:monovalent cation/H(+) antiporter subunit G [Terasakiella sp. A23]MDV7338799.1 monovalent cation/H(+) antiporter subunit G [Terasakiella sp. A23]